MLTSLTCSLQDECSFVSLRDVERAMIVFEYFYDKMEVFGQRMDNVAARDQNVCLPIFVSVCTSTKGSRLHGE